MQYTTVEKKRQENDLQCVNGGDGDCHGEVAFRESPSGSRIARCEYHDDKRWAIYCGEPVRAYRKLIRS